MESNPNLVDKLITAALFKTFIFKVKCISMNNLKVEMIKPISFEEGMIKYLEFLNSY